MDESMRKTLKEIAVWLVTLPLAAWIFTAAVNLFIVPSKVGIKFTPDHFSSPSLPLSPLKLLGGVLGNFGILSAVLVVPLLLIFIYLLAETLKEFREWSGPASDGPAQYPKLALRPETRARAVKWGSVLVVIAVILRVALVKPLAGDVSIPGKFLLAGRFFASFNAGLIEKSSFNEEEYTHLMLDALKFDRDEYFKFAESEYWAYSASKGRTTRTEREKASAKELAYLFNAGLLKEGSLERAAAVMKKGGEEAAAEAVLGELRNSK
jgi:hypothetical protein